ncbi:MAG TPA: hypothetical protein VFR74_06420 [Jiangellales bacterium]|nr:hypothetical protein [Jiangellales bacterium]
MVWLEIIGWAGSALVVWSLLQTRILRLRTFSLAGSLVLLVYNAVLEVWPMVGLNLMLAAINAVHLRRLLRSRHDEAAYEVLEVGPADPYLRYVLRLHEADIRMFNPGFVHDPAVPKRSAFLVQRGDETVGVVLARDAGDGVAQVDLDYVTPRFRDFSPGEFVYRRSGLFTDRGYLRVLTPPGMVEPYYERLGFARAGDSYALDLTRRRPE